MQCLHCNCFQQRQERVGFCTAVYWCIFDSTTHPTLVDNDVFMYSTSARAGMERFRYIYVRDCLCLCVGLCCVGCSQHQHRQANASIAAQHLPQQELLP